jgi:site-specific recombinase XerD
MHPNTIKQACQQVHAGFKSALRELVAELCSRGYADTTISFYEQGAVHFSFWLARRRISPSQLKEGHFADFLLRHASICDCPFGGVRQQKTVRAGLGHFAAILRSAGYLAPAEARVVEGVDLEVRRFDDYMLNTVGLQEATRLYRRRYVREFLDEFFPNGDVDPSRLAPRSIVSYLSKRGSRLKAASTKVLASSLRSYFRFLRLHGRCEEDLILAVPAPASWRLASLPPALTDEEVARLLSAFDRCTAAGRRDYAITRCLLDLGLRAQEVARLRLDDVDWRKGILRIVGTKSRRDDELPLTGAIGAAIAAYIRRGRPKTTSREVFLRLRAPVGQCMTRSTIGNLILRAATRAGMESTVTGPRILRHTAATRMLRRGASIKEIADVLRHKCLDTTAIYTKVDLPRLTAVALPWPIKGDR